MNILEKGSIKTNSQSSTLGVGGSLCVNSSRKILICPLNWGLGHATRCVPIIRQLLAEGNEPVIVSDGFPLAFLKQEFPSLRTIEFPSYSVFYASGKSQVGAMLCNLPKILLGIIKEHFWLRKLLKTEYFDQIISDNRFGLWSKKVHSIYITHQIMVKMPKGMHFLELLIYFLHRKFILKYKDCWIPDRAENGLSGDLAHKYPLPKNAKFIDTQSRFKGIEPINPDLTYTVVCVVSGLEPQRSIFERNLIANYQHENFQTLIILGQPSTKRLERKIANITILSHLQDVELASVLLGATKIICRSGYSSIMDLDSLNCLGKAEFVPTPGQTEQEYLAKYLLFKKNSMI